MKQLRIAVFLMLLTATTLFAQEKITLEDLHKTGKFRASSVYGLRSMDDGAHYTTLDRGTNVVKYAYATGKEVATLFAIDEAKGAEMTYIDGYQFSDNEQKILLTTNKEKIYRRSFKADYYVYDLASKDLSLLSRNGQQQLADFSPDGSQVAFYRDNNLHIKNLAKDGEVQITKDGAFNKIINGAPDWVYEEEFGFNKAYEWNADGSKIAFFRFDESAVKEFSMTMFQELYPEEYKFKYPKAGEVNAVVSIHIYDLKTKKTTKVDIGTETDQYIPRIKWTDDPNRLILLRLNRHQNKLDMLSADANTGTTTTIYTEANRYYVDINDDLTFTKDGFIVTSERDGFNHIYHYTSDLRSAAKAPNQVTKGDWEVTKFLGYDEANDQIYYTAAAKSPLQREVYSIKLDGSGKKELSTQEGTNRASFSTGFKYYINYFSSAETPTYVTLHDASGKMIRVLEENEELNATLKNSFFAKKEFLQIPTEGGEMLNAWMLKPANFDKKKKYPVFVNIYGGPGSQTVKDSWSYDWSQYLAQEGFIVVSVDNRGTGARGQEFKKQTYLQLGKLETIDQINAAKWLGTQSYIDATRIGIYGWSYGGYMSTLCLAKGADVFKMAIAVAPVTNWRFYDTIYTERYMRTPQENADGYDDNSPINHVDKIKGEYLLVHGTADDNVHFQNAMELSNALVKENIPFDSEYYTNKNHGIYGGNTRLHLFTKMVDFIKENL